MPLKSSPPPLNGVDHGEVGSEELRGFGQFSVGLSCRLPVLADSPDSPSSLTKPFPPGKSATPQPGCNLNLPVKQSQPTFSMNSGSAWDEMDMEHQALKAESFVHLTNDYHRAETRIASAANTRLPGEELGFADFTVFTEQSVHQWCCGFTPSGNPEKLDSRLGQRSSSNTSVECTYNPRQGDLWDPELNPHCLYKAREKECTIIRRWQEGDITVVRPSQDQQQPQETAVPLVIPSVKPYFENGVSDQNDLSCRGSSFETSEVQEDGGERSDKEEKPGNYHSVVISSTVTGTQSKRDQDLHFISTATQENSTTSSQPQSGTHSKDDASDADCCSESQEDPGRIQTADAAVLILGTLPPSDSFADFCAAPVQSDGEDLWAEFSDPKEQGVENTWTRAPASRAHTEDEDEAEQSGVTGKSSCQVRGGFTSR